jgi:hypothetical protein
MSGSEQKLQKRAVVVIHQPSKVNDFITWSEAKHDKIKANARFTALGPKLDTLKTDNDALKVSQKGCTNKPRTVTKIQRDKDWSKCKIDIKIIAGSVQEMADLDPENAEVIISEAGFDVKHVKTPTRLKNCAYDGADPGEVFLIGEGRGPRNWRWSQDEKNWNYLPASKTTMTRSRGHNQGEVYFFQNGDVVGLDEEITWSPSIRIRIRLT